jgi:hypothetical protein
MEIKDLAGLSKPLTRLIEVISQGVGEVSRPYLVRRNADAKAYEIRMIAGALKDVADRHQLPAVFKDGEIEMWQRTEDRTLSLEAPDYEIRSTRRLGYQQRKRQDNVECITAVAAAELSQQTEVADELPDEDWINRFFRAAEDVSSEQMQELWGRILSGEVTKPGSYSQKTLEFMRNINKSDADLIVEMAKLAVFFSGSVILPTPAKEWLRAERNIYPSHHFAAGELGIMYPTDLNYRIFREPGTTQEVFLSGGFVLIVDRGSVTSEIELPVWKFTRIGQEVLQLIPVDGDEPHLTQIGEFFAARNAPCKTAQVIERLPNGTVRFQNAKDVRPPVQSAPDENV